MNWAALRPAICSIVISWQTNTKTYNLLRIKCKKVHWRKENNTNPLFYKQWVKWDVIFFFKVRWVKSKFKMAVSVLIGQEMVVWGVLCKWGFYDKVPVNAICMYLCSHVCRSFQRGHADRGLRWKAGVLLFLQNWEFRSPAFVFLASRRRAPLPRLLLHC